MRYKLLGRSGLRVSELCLGTMTFGDAWGWGADRAVSQQMFNRYAEAGGNFIDTSVNYTNGQSETLVGEFIKSDRDHFVVATKYSLKHPEDTDPNRGGNHRKNMMRSVEQSLRQLDTDYIDVLYLHVWDHMTPVDEIVRGMDDLVRMGKVNYLAFSDTPAWIMAEANTRAELMGWTRFIAYQLPYSLASRSIERAEIPAAKHWEMAVLPWAILGGGLLTGKYSSQNTEPKRFENRQVSEREQKIIDAVQAVANETGCSPSQVAINWVRQQEQKAQIIPILGTRTITQLEDNLAALEWELTPEQLKQLDEASKIEYGFPRDFTEGGGRQYVFGKTFDQIDNHHHTYSPR
jgi:aryl-alcohol dehydrogenase-like predicted oxidoreductase